MTSDPSPTRLRAIAPGILLFAIAVAPLPLGSNRDWAWSPLALLISVSLVLTPISQASGRQSLSLPAEMIAAMSLISIVVLWSVLQLLPFGEPNTLLTSAAQALNLPPITRTAVDTESARSAIMRLLTYCGIFWLAIQFSRRARFVRQLIWTIVGSAVLVTLYGLIMQIDNGSCIVINIMKAPIGTSCHFSGTFRNNTNYAAFAGFAALLCVCEIQRRLLQIDAASTNFRQRLRARLDALSGVGGVFGGAAILLVSGMVLSGSKGASGSFFIACIFTIVIMNAAHGRGSLANMTSIFIAVGLMLAMLLLGGEKLLLRIFQFMAAGDDRPKIFLIALQAIELRPYTGWGLGSFSSVFSVLNSGAAIVPTYDKAHNTYLESAVELGIPVACCLVMSVILPALRCLQGVFFRGRDAHYPAMSASAALFFGLHSLFDFSIQIPAVAVAFSAILGMGWAQSRSSRQ